MTALITLTTVGADAGPFDLYSNADGFTVAFNVGITAAQLATGFLTASVPFGTTIVRVMSTGMCQNYVDIVLDLPIPMSCGFIISRTVVVNPVIIGGTAGLEDNVIDLHPEGGVVSIIARPVTNSSKFEIIHNGIKRATSAMTGLNGGPFENYWGMSPNYLIPLNASVVTIDQFIDTGKGAIPDRNAAYLAETGINYISAPAGRQMVWWKYSSADYASGHQAILRVTGSTTATFTAQNMCESTTTTSSTTEGPIIYDMLISNGVSSTTSVCASSTFVDSVKSLAEFPGNGDYILMADGITPFDGLNLWYMFEHMPEIGFKINSSGLVIQTHYCP